jgi:hypothetical protein
MTTEDNIQDQVQAAMASGMPVSIAGGNSKSFYGRSSHGESLSLKDYRIHAGNREPDAGL